MTVDPLVVSGMANLAGRLEGLAEVLTWPGVNIEAENLTATVAGMAVDARKLLHKLTAGDELELR